MKGLKITRCAGGALACTLLAWDGPLLAQTAGPAPVPSILVPLAPEVVLRDAEGGVTLRASRIDGPIRIDGRLDDSVYASVKSVSDFIQ